MLTLRALLADESLELTLIGAGADGALDLEVLWFHNTELPDPSQYIRESEAVLTNGLWSEHVSAEAFVAALVRARAAGLVFGLTAQTPEVPPALVRACADADVPLLALSVSVPFTAVTEAAARIHSAGRQEALAGMVRRGNALATSLSRGGGAAGVLSVLRRDHDLPLSVVDRMGRELASVGTTLTDEQLEAAAETLGSASPPAEVDLPEIGSVALFLVKGAIGGVDAGLFCLLPVEQLEAHQREALDQAARFLSLEVAKQQAVQAIEARFSAELLEMILSGTPRASEVPARLRAFGVDPTGPLAVLTTAFGGDTDAPPRVSEELEEFFAARGMAVVLAPGSQDVVAVFGWNDDQAGLAGFAEDLVKAMTKRHPGQRAVVGVGELADSAARLREPLVRSRETCHVLRRRRGGPRIASFAEVGTHTMLLGLHDQVTLRRFADDVLGPIRAQDAQSGTELERTLKVFLANDGQWAVTASEMYIHVNTLRNRLARIADLTGRDLARLDERVNLFLALEADAMS